LFKPFLTHTRFHDGLLLFFWITVTLFINPIGAFPINDDFSYALNVYYLAVKNVFLLDYFPAMNLVSQTLYGFVFVKLFGFSFTTLRISILLLTITSSFTFKRLLQLIGLKSNLALLMTVLLYFNSLCLPLAFTYMTDMFFGSMLVFGLHYWLKFLKTNQTKHFIGFVLFCVLAVLNRQHGLILPLLSMAFYKPPYRSIKNVLLVLTPLFLTWLAHDQYRQFLTHRHIAHGIRYSSDWLQSIGAQSFAFYAYKVANSIVVIGLIFIPLVLLQLPKLKTHLKGSIIMTLFSLGLCTYFAWYIRDNFPIGNINGLLSCGPKLIHSGLTTASPNFLSYVRTFEIILGSISFALLPAIGWYAPKAITNMHPKIPLILFLAAGAWLALAITGEAYFDRYNIPVMILLLTALVPNHQPKVSIYQITAGILIVTSLFSMIAVHDYFSWQKSRRLALDYLEAQDIQPAQIDGGFEYNGWLRPGPMWSTPGKSWWWVNDDAYIIASGRLENYTIMKYIVPKTYLPTNQDTLFVLKRMAP